MGRKHNNIIFLKFLITNICLFLIPLVTSIFVYNITLEEVSKDVYYSNLSKLEQCKNIIDRQLTEINSMVTHLAVKAESNGLLDLDGPPLEGGNALKILDMQQYISLYDAANTFISSLYVYFNNGDIIVTPYVSSYSASSFYGSFFKYGDMEYSKWHKEVLTKYHFKDFLPVVPITMNGYKYPAIAYLQSIPVDSLRKPKGTVVALIDENEIVKLLIDLSTGYGGWAYIVDSNNKVIAATSRDSSIHPIITNFNEIMAFQQETINGAKMLISSTTSTNNGWKYVTVIPSIDIMSKVNNIKRFMIFIISLTFATGLIIAFYMAYYNSKPIRDLINTIKRRMNYQGNTSNNDYELLESSISNLIEMNESLQANVKNQMPLVRMTFFERLLNGEFNSLQEIETLLSEIGLRVNKGRFVVLILRINSYYEQISTSILKELNVSKVLLKEILIDVTGNTAYFHDIDLDKIAVIMSLNADEYKDYMNYLENIADKVYSQILDKKYNISIILAAGNIGETILDTSCSYNEAKQALNYKVVNKKTKIIWYFDIPKGSNCYYYPLDVELKLENLIKAGDRDRIERLVKNIYEENFIRRYLSTNMVRSLIFDMQGTVLKLYDQVFEDNESILNSVKRITDSFDYSTTIDETFEFIIKVYLSMCNFINENKRSRNVQQKERIINYLNSNYTNPNISLVCVANIFGLNESYLSQFFKEHTGIAFSDYIENIRIRKACNLLLNSDVAINEIAETTGYNSATAFRRAFKRIEGVSPSDYKNKGDKITHEINMENKLPR